MCRKAMEIEADSFNPFEFAITIALIAWVPGIQFSSRSHARQLCEDDQIPTPLFFDFVLHLYLSVRESLNI